MMKPYYQDDMDTIYNGHAIEVLKELPDESVQMVMTSPPYWGLRNYSGGSDIVWGGDEKCEHKWSNELPGRRKRTENDIINLTSKEATKSASAFNSTGGNPCSLCGAWRGQLGLEPTPELYVEHLMMIFREVKRVLKKDGSFYLNLSDTYSASWGNMSHPPAWDYPEGRPPQSYKLGMQPKCMVCIPERVMFAMIEDKWILRNKLIWHKPNSMPSSVKDRFTTTWEYIYFFTKARKYYFDLDAVREPHATSSIKRASYVKHGEGDFYENGQISFSLARSKKEIRKEGLYTKGSGVVPFNLRVRDVKRGKGGATAQGGELKASEKEIEEYEYPEKHHGGSHHNRAGMNNLTKHDLAVNRAGNVSYTDPLHTRDYSPKGKNPGDIIEDYWELTTKGFKGAHFAVYPEKLCERPIKASSRVGDVVLDPFAGSGTTGVVAKRLGRKAILIDCVESYCAMARDRLSKVTYQPEMELE